jgi:uncharacterized membrane protein
MFFLGFKNKKFHESETKLADIITRFAGSMLFVYIHIIWFALWIIFADKIGDSFPFGLLTMIVSLEAIFLATFIMVNQNRQAEIADIRDKEDEKEQDEIEEDIEDIKEEFTDLSEDLSEVRRLIEKIESKFPGQEPPKVSK